MVKESLLEITDCRKIMYGQEMMCYEITKPPLIYLIAVATNSLILIDKEKISALEIASEKLIIIKNYILSRILSSDPNLETLIILFDEIYNLLQISNYSIENRVRKQMLNMINELQTKGIIGKYEIQKSGATFVSIKIFFKE